MKGNEMTKCYYEGIIYPNEEEFAKGVSYFCASPVNYQSIEMLCRPFIDNLTVNLVSVKDMNERMTNQELREALEKALFYILNGIYKKHEFEHIIGQSVPESAEIRNENANK